MFEVGFSELLMVGLVALIVIGPERLPRAARLAGLWIGRINASLSGIKADIQQQLHAEEMRQLMEQHQIGGEMERIIAETKAGIDDLEQQAQTLADDIAHHDKSA